MHIEFVCLGNICRSPTAHAVMESILRKHKLSDKVTVTSSGTGDWHLGCSPDKRAQHYALKRGIDMGHLRAEPYTNDRASEADLVLVMDQSNYTNVSALTESINQNKVHLFLEYAEDHAQNALINEVPDPYYGGDDGFDYVLDLIEVACEKIIKKLCVL